MAHVLAVKPIAQQKQMPDAASILRTTVLMEVLQCRSVCCKAAALSYRDATAETWLIPDLVPDWCSQAQIKAARFNF